MKKLICLFFLLISIKEFTQNVIIDYQAWNPTGTTCSLFVNPTNVPASGTITGSIEHQRQVGETVYNTTDKSLQMQTIYQTVGGVLMGARYRIAYNFKANYSYTIYITAAAIENTVGYGTGPYLRVDANNYAGGGSIGCNGPESLIAGIGGNPFAAAVVGRCRCWSPDQQPHFF